MKKQSDWKIMACLRSDGRATLTKISKMTNVPVSTLYDKLKSKNNGVIKRHTCLLNFEKLGFNTRAHISLKIGRPDKKNVTEFLSKHQHVNNLMKINNGYDFMVDVIFKDLKALEDFIDTMKDRFEINECNVYYIIDEIKQEAFLSQPDHINLVM